MVIKGINYFKLIIDLIYLSRTWDHRAIESGINCSCINNYLKNARTQYSGFLLFL